jgi:hypothetical protein
MPNVRPPFKLASLKQYANLAGFLLSDGDRSTARHQLQRQPLLIGMLFI